PPSVPPAADAKRGRPMAAMLPVPLDAIFSLLAPIKPAWVLPMVFSGMTVGVATLIDRRARLAALAGTAAIGAAPGSQPTPHPATNRQGIHDPGVDLRAELLAALSDVRR